MPYFYLKDLMRQLDVTEEFVAACHAVGLIPSMAAFVERDELRLRLALKAQALGFSLGELKAIVDADLTGPGVDVV